MQKPKLTDSVSVEELLTMRENGMSNHQIANALDISYATVVRYIGKAPFRKPGSGKKPVEKQEEPKSTLTLELQVTSYSGKFARYRLMSTGQVEMTIDDLNLSKNELEKFIVELMDIYQKM